MIFSILILPSAKKKYQKMSPKTLTFSQEKKKKTNQERYLDKNTFYARKEFRGKKIFLINAAG